MRKSALVFCCLCFASTLAYSQATSTLTPDEVAYFVSFFDRIGGASVSQTNFGNNLNAIEHIFGMNVTESNLLSSAAQAYRAKIVQIRQSEDAVTAGKATLTDADRSAIAVLIQTRDQTVTSVATNLLASVRPQTAARLRAEAQKIIALRASRRHK